jgi:hypothetical protein
MSTHAVICLRLSRTRDQEVRYDHARSQAQLECAVGREVVPLVRGDE